MQHDEWTRQEASKPMHENLTAPTIVPSRYARFTLGSSAAGPGDGSGAVLSPRRVWRVAARVGKAVQW